MLNLKPGSSHLERENLRRAAFRLLKLRQLGTIQSSQKYRRREAPTLQSRIRGADNPISARWEARPMNFARPLFRCIIAVGSVCILSSDKASKR